MNFYDKKVRKIMAITIMVIIIAMVATSVIPYLAWIIHGVAVKVAESHIVTVF